MGRFKFRTKPITRAHSFLFRDSIINSSKITNLTFFCNTEIFWRAWNYKHTHGQRNLFYWIALNLDLQTSKQIKTFDLTSDMKRSKTHSFISKRSLRISNAQNLLSEMLLKLIFSLNAIVHFDLLTKKF